MLNNRLYVTDITAIHRGVVLISTHEAGLLITNRPAPLPTRTPKPFPTTARGRAPEGSQSITDCWFLIAE